MSKIALTPNASGTGTLTIAAPNTNTDSTINLPDSAGSFVTANTSGDVGIGTSSPSTNLHVRGDGSGDFSPYNDVLRVQGDSYTVLHLKATNNQASMIYDRNGTTGWYSGLDNNGNYKMTYMSAMNGTGLGNAKDTGTPAMYIDSSGVVLVNTTSVVGAERLGVRYDGSTVNGIGIETTSSAAGAGFMVFRNEGGSAIGTISRNGGTNAVNYNTTSDYRLKENITPLTNALDRVSALNPVQWTWKDCDGAAGEGFIAHEVQAVAPLAVTGEKDAVDSEGNIKPQGMDSSYLVALLTKAIQEQQQTIESLEARVASLESA